MKYRIKDNSVKIPLNLRSLVNGISDGFYTKYKKTLVLTDGIRTAIDQATRFYDNFTADGTVEIRKKDYKNTKLFDEIAKEYISNKSKSKEESISAMTSVVQKQINEGLYISSHLTGKAVDFRTNNLDIKESDYLLALCKKQLPIFCKDERMRKNPHIHIQLLSGIMVC